MTTVATMKKGFLETKIETITSTDELRPAMNCVYFKDGFVYATNAHIAVKQHLVECHGLTEKMAEILDGKLLHRDTMKQLHSIANYEVTTEGIVATINGRKTTHHYFDPDCRFPNIEAVMPSEKNRCVKGEISFNVALLDKLSKVLIGGDSHVNLEFYDGHKPIKVTTAYNPRHQFGIIMPYAQ